MRWGGVGEVGGGRWARERKTMTLMTSVLASDEADGPVTTHNTTAETHLISAHAQTPNGTAHTTHESNVGRQRGGRIERHVWAENPRVVHPQLEILCLQTALDGHRVSPSGH